LTDFIDPSAYDFFLMTTIDLIDVFCRQSIIGINPINIFFSIGDQLCRQVAQRAGILGHGRALSLIFRT
jgi:hypothetical protein